jgi:hypothetical protein
MKSRGQHELRIRNLIEGGKDDRTEIQLLNGPRFFHFGYVTGQKRAPMESTLKRAERALIQYAKIVDWKLINNHHAGDAAFRRFGMNGSRYGRLLPKVLMAHK